LNTKNILEMENRMQSLKDIRERLKYSIAEMAQCLGMPKATYQCYENGSRKVPFQVFLDAEIVYQKHTNFTKEYFSKGGIMDRELAKLYPCGFMSGAVAE
jgi:transcriptional regulator with XRE-family HTH domain